MEKGYERVEKRNYMDERTDRKEIRTGFLQAMFQSLRSGYQVSHSSGLLRFKSESEPVIPESW